MTNRPRSHQLEDQSRLALGKALPPEWTVERVEHDYGVDLRVEVFRGNRPSGSFFFVQLKSTDRLPGPSGISVRVSTEHLNYWYRLPVPTMVVLWIAATDTLLWKWAHHHLPHGRSPEPKTQSIRLTSSDRLSGGDAEAIAREVAFCDRLKRSDLVLPVRVHAQSDPHRPLPEDQRVAFLAAWRSRVDRRHATVSLEPGIEQLHVTLEEKGFKARLGRVARAMGWPPDQAPSAEQLVDEIASTLALLLDEHGISALGADLLAKHGRRSEMVAACCPHLDSNGEWHAALNPIGPIVKSGRFGIAFDLAETWRDSSDATFREASSGLLLSMKAFEAKMSEADRSRLNRLVGEDPRISFLLDPETQLQLAGIMADNGQSSLAAEHYSLITDDAEKAALIDDEALQRMSVLHREASEYADAITCLIQLVRRDPDDDRRRLDLGICLALDGKYAQAITPLSSVNDESLHGEAWAWAHTVRFAARASGLSQQARQPAAAEEIARQIEPGEREAILALFERAVKKDALSPQTWRLHLALCGFDTPPPLGWEGGVPAALLAWHAPDWWGLAIEMLWQHGLVEPMLRATECALTAIGSDFPKMLEEGLPGTGFADPKLASLVAGIAKLKESGKALWARRLPGEGLRYEVEEAPADFRLFEVDLPPVQQWFEPVSG